VKTERCPRVVDQPELKPVTYDRDSRSTQERSLGDQLRDEVQHDRHKSSHNEQPARSAG